MNGLNDRQRNFAQMVVNGMAAGRAYEAAGYSAKGGTADSCATKLLRNAQVEEYMGVLRQKVEDASQLTLLETLQFLALAVRTPVGDIDEDSPLAQEVTKDVLESQGETNITRVKIKSVSKIEAIRLAVQIKGWNKPQQVEVGMDSALTDLFLSIRKS